ncbi:hypothetical protein C817_02681 [Dorea sp. 5-2]|nr:hypothetical protein C817_02681 [Dorea sp. 5-2]
MCAARYAGIGCRTDFADIQNKKNVEVTDNGKDDF